MKIKKTLLYGLPLVLAAVGGAVLADRKNNASVVRDEAALSNALSSTGKTTAVLDGVTNPEQTDTVTDTVTGTAAAPTTDAAVETPVTAPAAPVIPALTEIAYQPKSGETAAIDTVKAFYRAFNAGLSEQIVRQFDLNVPVTAVANAAVAANHPRPVSVTISSVTVRSDGSVVVAAAEVRSDKSDPLARELELMDTAQGTLLVAYRAAGQTDETSGF